MMFLFSTVTTSLAGKSYVISLFDTAGQEEFLAIRRLNYDRADLFVILCAMDNLCSLQNISEVWIKELPVKVPKILVINKSDFRGSDQAEVTDLKAEEIKNKLHLHGLFAVSASTGENVSELLAEIGKVATSDIVDTAASCICC